jgi:hypothetical protein
MENDMRVAAAVICLASIVSCPISAQAAAHARFVVDGLVNCTMPPVRSYPLHVEGVGNLTADRGATLAISGNVENTNYSARLGGRATAVEGGSAALKVTSRNSLQAIRDYPNNVLVVDLKVVGSSCSIKITHRLKPGRRQYTFTTALGLAYCDRPVTTSASCTPQ